jgi:Skp family chaperone for outer membrane proteins
MRLLSFVLAAAMASAALLGAPEALAQRNRNQAAGVVVIDYLRVVNETVLGRDMASKLQQIQAQVNTEGQTLAPERQSLAQEAQRLQQARRNMTDEQVRNSATLAPQFQQYQERARQLEVRAATLRGDYECSQNFAIRDFGVMVNPVIESVMRSRGAGVVLNAASAHYAAPENDITATVIQQLDQGQATRTATVARHPVTECLPQQAAQPGAGN